MNAGIYSAVSGSLAALTRLDAIANNIANASTPGFKAERFVQAADRATAAPSPTTVSTPLARGRLETDFSQGEIQDSGNPLDLAISGPGFFLVDGEQGERLTRRGSLSVDAEGFLATTDGRRVQGDGGDLRVGDGAITVGADGTVRANDAPVGKLRVVTVAEPAALLREGGTMFALGRQAPVDVPPEQVQIIQGALEGANLSPVESLVALVDTMRGFEAYMRAAERLDQVTAKAITDVGRV